MIDIGKKLHELRKTCGLTQKEVADAVDVAEATVSRWESGHISNMRRGRIEKLAKVLRVSPLVITERSGDSCADSSSSPVLSAEELDILRKYRFVDSDGKKVVSATLNAVYSI